ncbi:MAG: hypothetical protein L6R40_003111 [Gallowayella cf. fulva]|nr:MAG: hypothetical protein L6R40_003111 [Xanthomendoza cf. fulva]
MANTSPSMDSRLSILSPEPELGARTARLEEVTDHSDALDAQTSSGIGLGPIHRRFLERETWPLDPPESILQYRKFVKLMIDRIRAGESNTEELDGFLGLFDTGENWQYMVPVLGMLPELVEPGPQATNIHMTILLGHVGRFIDAKQKERADRIANSYPAPPKVPQDAEALKAEVRERVAKALFGPRGEKQATPAMTRLLTSTVEMFFSGEGAQQIIDENDKHGKDIDRDSLGLPTGLREFRSRSPKSTPEAPRKVTPCLLPKPAPGSPAPPVLQVPTESSSSDDGVDRQKSISHGLFKPADSASPPSSDDPPSTLTPNSSDEEKGVPNGLKSIPAAAAAAAVPLPPSNPATVPRPGFWDFVSTHSPEYADGVGPIYCKNWGIGRVKWCPSLSVSRKVTEEGTIVVEGFEKPPPETRYAILKKWMEADDM